MTDMLIRKTMLIRERIETDELGVACAPLTRVAACAVLRNPLAGMDREDLFELFAIGALLGERLASEIVSALGGAPVSYGKAAVVGPAGAFEHGAALLHPRLGKPVRQVIGGGEALMPANVKVAGSGQAVDLPLGHRDQAWSFDHIDTMTVAVSDAPRANEIAVWIAMSDGPRPRARSGAAPN